MLFVVYFDNNAHLFTLQIKCEIIRKKNQKNRFIESIHSSVTRYRYFKKKDKKIDS